MVLEFIWRGAKLKWDACSWPKFTNKEQKGTRPFYAEAYPYGTGWKAKVLIGNDIRSPEKSGDTPQEALEAALEALRESVETVVAIPVES